MLSILLLQLFWASFLIIGLSTALACQRISIHKKLGLNKTLKQIDELHPLSAALCYFVIGFTIYSPLIIMSYLLEWPVTILVVFYILSLIAAFSILFILRESILARLSLLYPLTKKQAALATILSASLLLDYVISLKAGGPLYGDAPVQLAKITLFTHSHFTLSDPYYAYNGVVDPRYSTNLMDAFQALAGKLFDTTAARVWLYSYGFYRFLIWISIFSLSWAIIPKKYRYWSYLVLTFSPVIFGSTFIYAELPDRIVFAWICLFILGLKLWVERRNSTLLIIASLLIATTHALFSLMALGFLCLFSLVLFAGKALSIKNLRSILICACVLVIPVALNFYYPNHTNESALSYNPGLAPPSVRTYGFIHISQLPPISTYLVLLYLFMLGCLMLANKASSSTVRLILYFTSIVFVSLYFNYNYLAIIGYCFMLLNASSKKARLLIGCLIIYYPLLIYNPLFWYFNQGSIPPWVTFRFSYFNTIGLIAPLIGLLCYTALPLIRWGYKSHGYYASTLVITAFIISYSLYNGSFPINYPWWQFVRKENKSRSQALSSIQVLSPYIKGRVVYSNDPDLSILIPGVVESGVIDFQPANESPMTDIAGRMRCGDLLSINPSYSALKDAKASLVLTDGVYAKEITNSSKKDTFLKLEKSYKGYYLYEIDNAAKSTEVPTVCSIPYKE